MLKGKRPEWVAETMKEAENMTADHLMAAIFAQLQKSLKGIRSNWSSVKQEI